VAETANGAPTSVVVYVFHLSKLFGLPSPFVAFPATRNVTVALPLAGEVQLNVQEAVPVGAAFGVECLISVTPFNAVPVMAVNDPAVAVMSNPSRKPSAPGVMLVLLIVNVIEYTVLF
jgi:hypothetical protein